MLCAQDVCYFPSNLNPLGEYTAFHLFYPCYESLMSNPHCVLWIVVLSLNSHGTNGLSCFGSLHEKKCTHGWLVTRKTSNNNAENVYMHKSVIIMGECQGWQLEFSICQSGDGMPKYQPLCLFLDSESHYYFKFSNYTHLFLLCHMRER